MGERLRDRPFLVCFAALMAAGLCTVWIPRYVPLTDYPQHLLIMQILTHYGDRALNYSEFYLRDVRNNPYMAIYIGAQWLYPFFSIETIGKIFLTCYLVLLPLGVAYLITSFDPNKLWIALLSVPLSFNLLFFAGLLNFLVSIPLVFFLLAALYRNFTYGVSTGRCLALGFLSVLLFYSHLSSFLGFLIAALPTMLLLRREIRSFWINLLCLLPSLGIFAAWYLHRRVALGIHDALGWESITDRLLYFLQPFMIYPDYPLQNFVYDPFYAALLAGMVALIFLELFQKTNDRSNVETGHGVLVAWAIFLLFSAATVFMPSTAAGIPLGLRYSVYTVLCGLTLLPRHVASTNKRRAFIFGLCLLVVGSLFVRAVRFDREMKTFERVIERMDYHSAVLPIVISWHGAGLRTYPYLHIICYYHIAKGGVSPYLFTHVWANAQIHPVRGKKLPGYGPGEWAPGAFDWARHSNGFRYFLVKGYDKNVFDQLFVHARLIFQEKDWFLFEQ